jgi:hypothetical protein
MTNPFSQLGLKAHLWEKRAKRILCDSTALLGQALFGSGQTLARFFQIVIAVTKFHKQLAQSNQVFNLIAQSPPTPTAQIIKFRPLLIGHADIESEIFLCHSRKAARAKL